MKPEPPQNPVGAFLPVVGVDRKVRQLWMDEISKLPSQLRNAVAGLSHTQLDTKYRNWTIRQLVHHIADSHLNSYIRFKLALTEDTPTIRPYDEGRWASLAESQTGDIGPSLLLIDGLHARWFQLLSSLGDSQFDRTFYHPESGETVSLHSALAYYAWHGRHHTGQILWLRETTGF